MNTKIPKIALMGYGTIGKEIEKAAINAELIITDIFDIDNPIRADKDYDFDVAIDFSVVAALEANVRAVAQMGKAIVIGTTGWNNQEELIKSIVREYNIGCIYDSNFSIGMSIFRKLIAQAAHLINNFEEYDIMMNEIHHNRKKDHPSGTAITLSEIIIENLNRKSIANYERTSGQAVKPEQLDVSCSRVGDVAGTHTIYIDSVADSIQLSHVAKNRSGFAQGAIFAAKWIFGRKGIYMLRDII